MIPFEEIDERLTSLGKDRVWLAENTPYSADYLRTVLAPSSNRRTTRVQEIISAAIEREQASQKRPELLLDRIYIEPSPEEYTAWCQAFKTSEQHDLKAWAIEALNKAAARAKFTVVAHQEALKVAEEESPEPAPKTINTTPYPPVGNGRQKSPESIKKEEEA